MKEKCLLTNEELIAACEKWISSLNHGKNWILQVPANYNKDPDLLFSELIKRFRNELNTKQQFIDDWYKN